MNQDVYDALCFALWHHQGGSSTIGQPIRKMLGMDQHGHMDKNELAGAKRVQSALSTPASKPLTDEQIERIYDRYGGNMMNCARAIERAHGITGEQK